MARPTWQQQYDATQAFARQQQQQQQQYQYVQPSAVDTSAFQQTYGQGFAYGSNVSGAPGGVYSYGGWQQQQQQPQSGVVDAPQYNQQYNQQQTYGLMGGAPQQQYATAPDDEQELMRQLMGY